MNAIKHITLNNIIDTRLDIFYHINEDDYEIYFVDRLTNGERGVTTLLEDEAIKAINNI